MVNYIHNTNNRKSLSYLPRTDYSSLLLLLSLAWLTQLLCLCPLFFLALHRDLNPTSMNNWHQINPFKGPYITTFHFFIRKKSRRPHLETTILGKQEVYQTSSSLLFLFLFPWRQHFYLCSSYPKSTFPITTKIQVYLRPGRKSDKRIYQDERDISWSTKISTPLNLFRTEKSWKGGRENNLQKVTAYVKCSLYTLTTKSRFLVQEIINSTRNWFRWGNGTLWTPLRIAENISSTKCDLFPFRRKPIRLFLEEG